MMEIEKQMWVTPCEEKIHLIYEVNYGMAA